MTRIFLLWISLTLITGCGTTSIFVVRHTEKETSATMSMTSDVPLSQAGKQRAEALSDSLINQHIQHIYSTNFLRTRSTAEPLAKATGLSTEIYDAHDSLFTKRLLKMNDGNILVVGHSNTVDDLVNQLAGKTIINGDLPETEYGDLFVVKKKGKKIRFERRHFGN